MNTPLTPLTPHDQLLRNIAAGDVDAFEELYRRYSSKIFSAVMMYTKDKELGKDIVQQVFTHCWEKRSTFDDIRSIEDYLFIAARNEIRGELRKIAHRQRLLENYLQLHGHSNDETDAKIKAKQYEETIRKAIAGLSAQQQTIYRLRQEEELSYEEIANRLTLSKLTVKKHLELARQSVRQYIREHLPEELWAIALLITWAGLH